MKQTTDLQHALRRLAQMLPREAGPATEQRVVAAFRARRKRSPRAWIYAALVASLVLASAWFLSRHPLPPTLTPASNYPAAADFMPLPYAQSDVPLEQAVIVRVKLQPSEWVALGVPAAPSKTGTAISADLLIGQDGIARAVRLVSVP